MKNNIILILIVTVISIAVIIISIAVSVGGHSDDRSLSESTTSAAALAKTTVPADLDEITSEPSEETPQPDISAQTQEEPDAAVLAAEDIIALARSLEGTEFADGGEAPSTGFDNSGFIYYVLRENGYITCPRGVSGQSSMGTTKTYDRLSPGDLVFFSEDGAAAEFGGIYVGNGVMIACLMPGTQVREVDITSEYYLSHFYCGVGII